MQHRVDDDRVAPRPPPEEATLLAAVRAGDEDAFTHLVRSHNPSLRRLARMYVFDPAAADEVVQETWVGFLESHDRFEGRSSLKTWLFRILLNKAKQRIAKDRRTIPFSALDDAMRDAEPSEDPARFRGPEDRWPGHWISFPNDWSSIPEYRVTSAETFALIGSALEDLPPAQREVVSLRDVEGWSSQEVCNVLGLSETNQRVLLHRGRSKMRRTLENHLGGVSR